MTIPMLAIPTVFAAAPPWTYWIAVAEFLVALMALVAVCIGYYRRVSVPAHLMRERERQLRLQRASHEVDRALGQPSESASWSRSMPNTSK